MKITRIGAVIALSMALMMSVSTFPTQASSVYTETAGIPPMENPVKPNTKGIAALENDDLLDFIIPDTINGVTVDAIGAYAFEGCDLIRTVSIPASVTEIGEYAFANCPYLQTIILKDRSDMTDLWVGTNWAGDAQVLCEYTLAAPVISPEEQRFFQERIAEATQLHEISEETLPLARSLLTELHEIYTVLNEKDPNSENTHNCREVIQGLSRLIVEYEDSLHFAEPPAQQMPDDSDSVPEDSQDVVFDDPIVSDEPTVSDDPIISDEPTASDESTVFDDPTASDAVPLPDDSQLEHTQTESTEVTDDPAIVVEEHEDLTDANIPDAPAMFSADETPQDVSADRDLQ